jgi:GT2 family glycosyltransferase
VSTSDDLHVTAVVVTWDSAAHVEACLAALDAQDHPTMDVIVVDNASRDGTLQLLDQALAAPRRHPLRVVRNGTNRGFCGGVNDALELLGSRTTAVLLVNPDVVAAEDVVTRCLAALGADPRRGSVQPKLVRTVRAPDGRPVLDTTGHVLTRARLVRNRDEGAIDVGQRDVAGEVFGASGALVLHRRDMLDDIAWRRRDGRLEHLTEDLVAYFDDVEVDWRARLRGWSCWYEPAATAEHERGGAGPRRTSRVEVLNFANRLLVVATCDDGAAVLRALPLVLVTTTAKLVELTVTVPRALPGALGRCLRLWPAARRRRRQLMARATVAPADVVATHVVPFRFRPWIVTWWRRITGRSLGVARRR